jgi:hypothetical protein
MLMLIFAAFLILAVWHVRVSRGAEFVVGGFALGATVIITLVVGAFDAVLLLAPPTLIVWLLLGALSESASASARRRTLTAGVRQWAPVVVFALGIVGAGRSALQIAAMETVTGSTRTSSLERATLFDPGSFRIRMRLGEAYLNAGRCERARAQARAARDLYPMAESPRQLLAACGESSPRPRKR